MQLERHVTTVQRLTSQQLLREKEGRLRQREEQLQHKDAQIQQISRLQREIQRLQVGIKKLAMIFIMTVHTFQGIRQFKVIGGI